MPLEMVSMCITLTALESGGQHTTLREFEGSLLGGMNAKEVFTAPITCPQCATLLTCSVGLSTKLNSSKLLGSTSTQESSSGMQGLSIVYQKAGELRISSGSESLTLTAHQISFLRQLPGYHNLPLQLIALVELCSSMMHIPGSIFSSKYTTPLSSKSLFIDVLRAASVLSSVT